MGIYSMIVNVVSFVFQAEDGIRVLTVTGVQTCALPISGRGRRGQGRGTDIVTVVPPGPDWISTLSVTCCISQSPQPLTAVSGGRTNRGGPMPGERERGR